MAFRAIENQTKLKRFSKIFDVSSESQCMQFMLSPHTSCQGLTKIKVQYDARIKNRNNLKKTREIHI